MALVLKNSNGIFSKRSSIKSSSICAQRYFVALKKFLRKYDVIDVNNSMKVCKCQQHDCPSKNECTTVGPASCHIPLPKKPPCNIRKIKEWPGPCDRVCMPCCCPAEQKCTFPPLRINTCKTIAYKYPSFTETATKLPFKEKTKDCCSGNKCDRIMNVGDLERASIIERQNCVLRHRKTPKMNINPYHRKFSTYTRLLQSDQVECPKKGTLPCLKRSDTKLKQLVRSRKTCDKLCMPCCRPARDPPECFFPYVKPKCIKLAPPRPAFSECKALLKQKPPCECLPPTEICRKPGAKDDSDVGCNRK